MDPMYLPEIEKAQPTGHRAESVRQAKARGEVTPQILHLFAFKPERTKHLMAFTQDVMRGPSPLSGAFRELISAFVSSRNNCKFCAGSHIAVAEEMMGGERDVVKAVISDYRTAPISEKEKAVFPLVEKAVSTPWKIVREDVDKVRAAGWTDAEIYDAMTVVALFKFYNTWINSTGVQDMTPEAYGTIGKRMAVNGYPPLDT